MKRLLSLVAVLAILVATGCGGTVLDNTKTEEQLVSSREKETGKKVSSVDCPSGVDVKAGTTFECTIHLADGKEEIATLKIRNDKADLSLVKVVPAQPDKKQ